MEMILKKSTLGTDDRNRDLAHDTAEQLRMAGKVQRNFLPKHLPNSDKFRWAAVFEPADWVSGDIYDVARLDEEHIGFYIADAVGHSMPAALLTMFLKQAIAMRETHGDQYRIFEPVDVVRKLNSRMVEQDLAGCLFATCCYCLLNVRTLEMTFSRAGHPYPILIRKNQQPEQAEDRGGLLGIFSDAHFEQSTIQLEQGDKIFLYSDGGESTVGSCSENGEFVFTEQFCYIANMPAEEMASEFKALAMDRDLKPGELDDVTAVVLEIL